MRKSARFLLSTTCRGKVKLADGRVVDTRRVVSNVGVANTFGRLLPAPVAERFGLTQKLRVLEPSLAHVNLYVGLRQSARELGLGRTNLWGHTPEHDLSLVRTWPIRQPGCRLYTHLVSLGQGSCIRRTISGPCDHSSDRSGKV